MFYPELTQAGGQLDSSAQQASLETDAQIVENIKLVEYFQAKQNEPLTDPHAAAIVQLGKKAGPALVEKILDDKESKHFDFFKYKVGDIAAELLCVIYQQDPSLALIARKPPIDAGHGHYYLDYVALVETRKGREELRDAWKRIVEVSNQKQAAVSLDVFLANLNQLKNHHFGKSISAQDIYRLKRNAADAFLPGDSWEAILQLWLAGEYDFVELLWWQKDNHETRALIIALEWCMVSVPEKNSAWPKGINDFEGMAERFGADERNARLQEADFVRQNRKILAKELNSMFSSSDSVMAKRYEVVASVKE